jgi:hypothetical protein
MTFSRTSSGRDFFRRATALLVLVTFALGNIGWPANFGVSGKKCQNATGGKPGCCCSSAAQKASRCCCQKRAAKIVASCCQKKAARQSHDVIPVLNCGCGDAPDPAFIISTQPKLAAHAVEMPELAAVSPLLPAAVPLRSGCALPPETPPPRPSVC